jgi:hypothetical protein
MRTTWRRALALLWLVLVTGCMKKPAAELGWAEEGGAYGYGGDDAGSADDYDMDGAVVETASMSRRAAPRKASRAPAAPPPAAPMMADGAMAMGGGGEGQAALEPPAPAPAADRMVFYNGFARLRVARVESGVADLTALAGRHGGSVERVSGSSVTLRVPVAAFRAAFAEVLGLGEVLDKSITAEDVTDAFTAVDLRLNTARATRDRLVQLLAKAEDEREKLELVRQIQRVTEEIDVMEARLRMLGDLASRSRISVDLVPREALAWQGPQSDAAELGWIRRMSPFRPDLPVQTKKLMLAVPDGMVALDVRRAYVAESPDGARIWSHRIANRPLGDAGFWLDAVTERIAKDFASAERSVEGEFQALTLVDRGDDPYTWVIAVRVVGDRLDVVQAYFPGPAQTARYRDAVRAVLQAAGGAA